MEFQKVDLPLRPQPYAMMSIKKQSVSKKVVNSEVDKKVKNIDKQIEKLEAEKSQAKKVKSVATEHIQNDFEKHAAKKKQEKKVMKNENQQNDEYRITWKYGKVGIAPGRCVSNGCVRLRNPEFKILTAS